MKKTLFARFGKLELEDVVDEFMQVRQDGSIGMYQDKFEELKVRMKILMPNLGESYFLFVFIGGIKNEIRPMVRFQASKERASISVDPLVWRGLLVYNCWTLRTVVMILMD